MFPLVQSSEVEHYWNNAEDDGQSLSDCASDIFDDDLGLGETPAIPAPEPVPEKKKRPPRKKKKRQQQVPLETTDEGNEDTTADEKGTSIHAKPIDRKENTKEEKPQPSDGGEPDVASNKTITKPPQATSESEGSSNSISKSLNPNAKVWGMEPSAKPTPQASLSGPMAAPQSTQPKAPENAPKPGTWASMAVSKSKPNNTRPTTQPWGSATAPKAVPPPAPKPTLNGIQPRTSGEWSTVPAKNPPPSAPLARPMVNPQARLSPLSPDWRTHVSPHLRSPKRQAGMTSNGRNIGAIPPPPIAKPEQTWPSLGDFPAPPGGAKLKDTKPAQSAGTWGRAAKPKGAWGKA